LFFKQFFHSSEKHIYIRNKGGTSPRLLAARRPSPVVASLPPHHLLAARRSVRRMAARPRWAATSSSSRSRHASLAASSPFFSVSKTLLKPSAIPPSPPGQARHPSRIRRSHRRRPMRPPTPTARSSFASCPLSAMNFTSMMLSALSSFSSSELSAGGGGVAGGGVVGWRCCSWQRRRVVWRQRYGGDCAAARVYVGGDLMRAPLFNYIRRRQPRGTTHVALSLLVGNR
jgi:hypothetical protein